MTIHKGNIEAFLLDYLEGNLDPLLTADLMAFMAENPGYEKWLPEYDGHLCLSGGPEFEEKGLLKKDFADIPGVNDNNFEEFCIASAEGLLHEGDVGRLSDFIALYPEKQGDYDLYHRLKLKPDMSLIYPGKALLKKRAGRIIPMRFVYYALGAAASAALLLMLVSRKPATQVYSIAPVSSPAKIADDSFARTVAPETLPVTKAVHTRKLPVISDAEPPIAATAVPGIHGDPGLSPLAYRKHIRETLKQDNSMPDLHMNLQAVDAGPDAPVQNPGLLSSRMEREPSVLKFVGGVIKKLNFWKAAESAISGFNYLTESQLSISKTTDQNGKLTGLALGTEQYVISGNKIK